MRISHISGDGFVELEQLPDTLPAAGYLWVGVSRQEFESRLAEIQGSLQRWTGGQLVDLHVSDLLNQQLPSHFDYTSWYDLMVFRRLAPGINTPELFLDAEAGTVATARAAFAAIDTSPVGFAVFDRVLLTVHPADCMVREYFAAKMAQMTLGEGRSPGVRLPTSPADLMLRMVNYLVDSYLELRRLLTRQFDVLQQELFAPQGLFEGWQVLLESRNAMQQLEDTSEDQRSAVQEWIDGLEEWPATADAVAQRERELLRVRSRDVLEHIERVLTHVRRLESSAETAVQMHFSAVGNRTNDIMRTLTVLTAIFLPLNLITGIFGMNFESLPLIHRQTGFWIAAGMMALVGLGLGVFFWRKRYLGTKARR